MERICFSGLLVFLLYGKIKPGGKEAPFEVCGTIYARPPREVYASVLYISLVSLLYSWVLVVMRCNLWILRKEEFRNAHLVPCIRGDFLDRDNVSYRAWWIVMASLVSYLIIPIFIAWFLGHLIPASYLALGFIIALQVLNILLALVRIYTPPHKRTLLTNCFDMISILVIDEECEARNREINQLSRVDFEHNESSSQIAEISPQPDLVVDSVYLKWLRNDRGRHVKIQGEHPNFELIHFQVPYSIMWYSVYEVMNLISHFRGADEIDKCLLWLVIVSTMTTIFVSYIPGPCVVIKKMGRQTVDS